MIVVRYDCLLIGIATMVVIEYFNTVDTCGLYNVLKFLQVSYFLNNSYTKVLNYHHICLLDYGEVIAAIPALEADI